MTGNKAKNILEIWHNRNIWHFIYVGSCAWLEWKLVWENVHFKYYWTWNSIWFFSTKATSCQLRWVTRRIFSNLRIETIDFTYFHFYECGHFLKMYIMWSIFNKTFFKTWMRITTRTFTINITLFQFLSLSFQEDWFSFNYKCLPLVCHTKKSVENITRDTFKITAHFSRVWRLSTSSSNERNVCCASYGCTKMTPICIACVGSCSHIR